MNIDRFMARAVSENVVVQGREQHLRHLLDCELSGEIPHQSYILPVDNQLTQPEPIANPLPQSNLGRPSFQPDMVNPNQVSNLHPQGMGQQSVLSAEHPGLSEPIANPLPVQTPIATEPPVVTESPVVYPLHPGLTREEWQKQQADKAVK